MKRFLRVQGAFLVVLVLGGALRLAGVGYGLPRHDLGQDEIVTDGRVRQTVMRGGPNTPAYNWPSLQVYLSKAAVKGVRAVERRFGLPRTERIVIGRILTVGLCSLTLVWLYMAATRLFDQRIGVVSAAFLALVPIHVYRSRMWVPDAPMTMFYTLALLAAVLILRRPSWGRFAFAGLAIGLATATKYNGVGAALPVIVAALMAGRGAGGENRWGGRLRPLIGLGLAALVSVVTFFAVDPPALLRLDKVIHGAAWVSELYRNEPPTGPVGWHIVRYVGISYFAGGIEGVGPYVSSLALLGVAFLVACRSRPGVLVWLPPLLYLLLWSSTLRTAYERAFLPLVPHIALAAALAAVTLAEGVEEMFRIRWPGIRVAGVLLLLAVLAATPPVVVGVSASRQAETRLLAMRWINDNLPRGARIAWEWDMLRPTEGLFDSEKQVRLLGTSGQSAKRLAREYDYVIVSGTTRQWIMRQRARPGFAERAVVYDEISDGRRFELVKQVTPSARAFGPEICIYRTRRLRGPRLGDRALPLRRGGWANSERLKKGLAKDSFELRRHWNLAAGRVVATEPGRWSLVAEVTTDGRYSLSLALGEVSQEIEITGSRTVRLTADLPAGQTWWLIKKGKGYRPGDRVTISGLRLEPEPPGTGTGSPSAGA